MIFLFLRLFRRRTNAKDQPHEYGCWSTVGPSQTHLGALIVLGTAVLGERGVESIPFPASSCNVARGYWAIIFDGNFYDYSSCSDCEGWNEGCTASNLI